MVLSRRLTPPDDEEGGEVVEVGGGLGGLHAGDGTAILDEDQLHPGGVEGGGNGDGGRERCHGHGGPEQRGLAPWGDRHEVHEGPPTEPGPELIEISMNRQGNC